MTATEKHAFGIIIRRKTKPILAAASYAYNPSREKQWSHRLGSFPALETLAMSNKARPVFQKPEFQKVDPMENSLRITATAFAIAIIGWAGITQASEMQSDVVGQEVPWFTQIEWQVRSDGTRSLVVEGLNSNSNSTGWDLRAGDRVVAFAGVTISSPEELQTLSNGLAPGDWRFTVLRKDQLLDLQPIIESISGEAVPNDLIVTEQNMETPIAPALPAENIESPSSTRPAGVSEWALGFQTLTFCPEIWTGLETPVMSGALIRTVLNGSMAEEAGLIPGAIIVAVDGKRIDSAKELAKHLDAKSHPLPMALLAYHGRTLKRHRFGNFEILETPAMPSLTAEKFSPPQVFESLPPTTQPAEPLASVEPDATQGTKEDQSGPKLVDPRAASPKPRPLEKEISAIERELREQEAVVRRLKARLRELQSQSQDNSRQR